MERPNPLNTTKKYYQLITGVVYLLLAAYIFTNPPERLAGEDNATWRLILICFLAGYGLFRLVRAIMLMSNNKL